MKKSKPNYPLLIQEFEVSGLSQPAFCRLRRVKLCTFQYWLYRIRKNKSKATSFLPIEVKFDRSGAITDLPPVPIEIQYPDGIIVRLSTLDTRIIHEFIPALGQ